MHTSIHQLLTIISVITLAIVLHNCNASRVLVVLPNGGKSHFFFFEPFIHELARRGHHVTVVSPFPQDVPKKGITDINIEKYSKVLLAKNEAKARHKYFKVFTSLRSFRGEIDTTMQMFKSPDVNRLFDPDQEHFDVVFTELFDTDALLMVAHKLNAPNIAISSCTLLPWANARFGNPDNPAYIPILFSDFNSRMTFRQRLTNTALWLITNVAYYFYFTPASNANVQKYFNQNEISLEELAKDTSLVFVNSHHSLHGARPHVPKVIEVGGISVKQAKPLPKDLEKFITESKHGVIYFCTGSMLRASTLPSDKRDALINVFSRLPQRVLWKWEDETMPGKPDNVKLVKWMPQRDILGKYYGLAHPNVRVFISHCGLLGTTEAVHSGVPILGMPFYGDQSINIEAIVANGAGIRLDFEDLNKDTLYEALTKLLNNPMYKENAKDLSERFRDRPQTPLETAVYWTEYVIRHKGASHLRSAAVDLTWYQYLLLDVIAFMILVSIAMLTFIYYSLKCVYKLTKRRYFVKPLNTRTKRHKD